MMGFTQQAMETERKQVQLELSKAKARDRELDTLFEKLYEDNVAGKISDERSLVCPRSMRANRPSFAVQSRRFKPT